LGPYAAGYYSYLYCKVFSANLWDKLFKNDPWSATAGETLKREMLQHGGARDPKLMLDKILGGEPNFDLLLPK
jgi:intermediate peptidase